MPQDERAKTSDSPSADPAVTPGLEAGGGVQPGDTPPAADSMSGALGDDRRTKPNMGPISGNRTPMIFTLVIVGLFVLMVVGFGIAQIVARASKAADGEQTSMGEASVSRSLLERPST